MMAGNGRTDEGDAAIPASAVSNACALNRQHRQFDSACAPFPGGAPCAMI